AVLVDVIAAEEEVAHLEAKLSRRVPRRVPDIQFQIADLEYVSFVEGQIDLARRHGDLNSLSLDRGVRLNLVGRIRRTDAEWMGRDLGLEAVFGGLEPLDVVGVGVGSDDHLAFREAEIRLAD